MIRRQGNTNHFATLEAGESIRRAEIGAGTHAKDDDALERAALPDANANQLAHRHLRSVIPFLDRPRSNGVFNEAEKERGVRIKIHGRNWDTCEARTSYRVAIGFPLQQARRLMDQDREAQDAASRSR